MKGKWQKHMQKGIIKEDNLQTQHLPQADLVACPQESNNHFNHFCNHHFQNHERHWHETRSNLEEHHILSLVHHKIPISGLSAPKILPM